MRLHPRIALVGSGEIGLSDSWDCHVYLVDGGSELALIDAGGGRPDSYTRILHNLAQDGFDPARIRHILLTHWHADHARGAAGWRTRLDAPVYLPEIERTFLEEGHSGGCPCPVDLGYHHGDRLGVGDLSLEVIQVPGHSQGICAFLLDLDGYRVLFGADIVFIHGVIGLINHEGSELGPYRRYLPRLAGLGVDALLPGHLLFVLNQGQRHIDLALDALKGGFVPPTIGQSGITFRPPPDY
jgi:glyoxylase-like metal-dependent hydrolase (beta-lactamase superfamily II)